MANPLLRISWWLPVLGGVGVALLGALPGHAQSINKQQVRAINRTHLRVVTADTVQQFALAARAPRTRASRRRVYYWYAHEQVQHAQGEYNGRLLHGPYRVLTREGQPLRKGQFRQGLKTGRWQAWHPNGQVAQESRWRRGHLRGQPHIYDLQGHDVTAAATEPQAPSASRPRWWRRLWPGQRQAATGAPSSAPDVGSTAVPTNGNAQPPVAATGKSKKKKAPKQKKPKPQKQQEKTAEATSSPPAP